ncbi:MAG: hypothetical protein JNL58_23210 [Planctomyces sp.]|nr:hypothetical protein [Planctomyces sp.]
MVGLLAFRTDAVIFILLFEAGTVVEPSGRCWQPQGIAWVTGDPSGYVTPLEELSSS